MTEAKRLKPAWKLENKRSGVPYLKQLLLCPEAPSRAPGAVDENGRWHSLIQVNGERQVWFDKSRAKKALLEVVVRRIEDARAELAGLEPILHEMNARSRAGQVVKEDSFNGNL